jgi:hypothetical protein
MTPEERADWYAQQDGDWHCAHCRDKAVRLINNAIAAEREACAKIADDWTRPDNIRLHAGELSRQEMRTVVAIVTAIAASIRARKP